MKLNQRIAAAATTGLVGIGMCAIGTTSTASAQPKPACMKASQDQQVKANLGKVPRESSTGNRPWVVDSSFTNSFKQCTDLSFVALTFKGATGNSVEPIMLFHKGTFIGTATSKAHAVSGITQTSDETIKVVYSDANHGKHTATYTYSGGKVHASGADPAKIG